MSAPRPQHPRWCSQGEQCEPPRRHPDGSIEWSHWMSMPVKGEPLSRAAVMLVRIEHLAADGRHDVHTSAYVEAAGPLTADELDALAAAAVEAARMLRAGLAGTPGGLPAVIAAAEDAGGAE